MRVDGRSPCKTCQCNSQCETCDKATGACIARDGWCSFPVNGQQCRTANTMKGNGSVNVNDQCSRCLPPVSPYKWSVATNAACNDA